MAYITQEESVQEGKPAELYLFQNDSSEIFSYTSAQQTITFDNRDYEPIAIERNEPDVGDTQDSQQLVITVPQDNPVVVRYVSGVPLSPDRVTIYRQHTSDLPTPETVVYFSGNIVSVAFTNNVARMSARPQSSTFQRPIPRRSYSASCGHVLYDRGCKVNDTDPSFDFSVTVTAVGDSTIDVAASGLSALASDFFVAGFLDRAGLEQRMVLTQTDLGGDVLRLGLLLPFNAAPVTTVLNLKAGCDHTLATCRDKFNNVNNHGGFPFVPTKNPFESGIVE